MFAVAVGFWVHAAAGVVAVAVSVFAVPALVDSAFVVFE